jgi:hypothetical protein
VKRRDRRAAPAGRDRGAPRGAHVPAPRGVRPWLGRACLFAPLAAIAALAWSLRGAPLGTPVADDFEFVSRVVFHAPLDPFDSMGASYYWRPLSRQAWFPLVTPLVLGAPWAVAAIHLALVGAIAFVLARIARRIASAPVAALAGAAVIATEPVRALVTWPSGIQHLLAALGLSLAAHEALAGRRWTAAIAAVAAALSHDMGSLAFAVVALGGLLRGEGRPSRGEVLLGLVLGAAWVAGYRVALAHGVELPPGGVAAAMGAWFRVLPLIAQAAFNGEALQRGLAAPLLLGSAALVAWALFRLARGPRREDRRRVLAAVGIALAIAALGVAPLGSLLPDWNAWRAFVPVLALAFAATLLCATAHPALGLAIIALRIAALAGAEPAAGVTGVPPPAVSDLSFTRLTRVQRAVSASGDVVRAARLPRGGRVAYLGLPEMTTNGFQTHRAVQVWTRDTSARFVAFEIQRAGADTLDLVLAFDTREGHAPALALTPEARRLWRLASQASHERRIAEAYDLYARSRAAQHPEAPSLSANVLQNLALYELHAEHIDRADSLRLEAERVRGPTANGYALEAFIALRRGDLVRARRKVETCLRLEPKNPVGRAALAELRRAEGAAP